MWLANNYACAVPLDVNIYLLKLFCYHDKKLCCGNESGNKTNFVTIAQFVLLQWNALCLFNNKYCKHNKLEC